MVAPTLTGRVSRCKVLLLHSASTLKVPNRFEKNEVYRSPLSLQPFDPLRLATACIPLPGSTLQMLPILLCEGDVETFLDAENLTCT